MESNEFAPRYNKHVDAPEQRGGFFDPADPERIHRNARALQERIAKTLSISPYDVHVMIGTRIPDVTPPLAPGQVTMTVHFPPSTSRHTRDLYAGRLLDAYAERHPSDGETPPAIASSAPYALDLTFQDTLHAVRFFNELRKEPVLKIDGEQQVLPVQPEQEEGKKPPRGGFSK